MALDGQVADIDRMHDREFEYFVADLWRRQGYNAHLTQQSGDGGADVIAENGEERLAIEAKWRSDGKIGPGHVRKIAGVAKKPGFDGAVLVTNREFTDAAYREANQMGVRLFDGGQMTDLDRQTRRVPADSKSGSAESARSLAATIGGLLWYIISDPERLIRGLVTAIVGILLLYVFIEITLSLYF